ncbi:MAG: AMP-binding protein [Alcaligenaceae bacterium]|nr:AMP-binding protein [Alcaligenaceae bacterium]
MNHPYEEGLERNTANYSHLTPVSFLERAAHIFPDRAAVIDDDRTLTWRELHDRCKAMAGTLHTMGIRFGDTVSFLCHNSHELLEAHYFIPMAGAVLNALNTRLDAGTLSFIMDHCKARILFYDTEFEPIVSQAIQGLADPPTLVAIARQAGPSQNSGILDYETLCAQGDRNFQRLPIQDEWQAISLNYTSGTTGNPKGVAYHHRGAWMAAMSNAMAMEMNTRSVYLWTLPMFHCNGWCYTWAVTAACATHICLRKVETQAVSERIRKHGVTHMCGAPIVLNMLVNELHQSGLRLDQAVQFAVGGAAPPSPVIRRGREIGFDITHLYGLTESYGPSTLCVRQPGWEDLPIDDLASKMARQGVETHAINALMVADPDTLEPVPADGQTLGELLMRGNTLMKGYFRNRAATDEAFSGGWLHTGDLAVMHPDGYVEVKDRAKDIIISGGENISSQEIEDVLYRHPAVSEAAVVAMEDPNWGESPCAFVALRTPDADLDEAAVIAFCRQNMAGFKVPRKVVFGDLPKTSTGKIRKNVLRDGLKKQH